MAAVIVLAGSGLGAAAEPTAASLRGIAGPISFVGNRVGLGIPEGNREAITINREGIDQSPLTVDTTFDRDPVRSLDGRTIAFANKRDRRDEQRRQLIHESGHQSAHLRSSETARTRSLSKPGISRADDAAPA
jgi:hypothetical protein